MLRLCSKFLVPQNLYTHMLLLSLLGQATEYPGFKPLFQHLLWLDRVLYPPEAVLKVCYSTGVPTIERSLMTSTHQSPNCFLCKLEDTTASLGGWGSLGTSPPPPLLSDSMEMSSFALPRPSVWPQTMELWPWMESMSQNKPLLPLHRFLRYLSQWQEGDGRRKRNTKP